MKRTLIVLISFCTLSSNAQNYLITFAGTGASTTVTSVKVENLMKGTSLILNGSDILHLTVLTGLKSVDNGQSYELKIYPNPMNGNAILQVSPPVAGDALISVLDMTGKSVVQIQSYLDNGLQKFRLSGLKSGLYLISVKGNTFQYSEKLLCNSRETGRINIEKISSDQASETKIIKENLKGELTTVDMDYTIGDRLKFTGTSGSYSTVKIDIPTSDKTIAFDFIVCADGDNNNYTVVETKYGVWMAENLRTTKFNDGILIPQMTINQEWSITTTPAYCWYENDDSNGMTYGALYNWYTVHTNKLCPVNWHVSNISDWEYLKSSLGGASLAGDKLKEQGTTHWESPNTGATNEAGFTAVGSGERNFNGDYMGLNVFGIWWTPDYHTFSGTYYYIESNNATVQGGVPFGEYPNDGYSVRCVKD